MLTLYGTTLSANARKVLAVAHHLELDFEFREVNVYAGEGADPEFRKLSPAGKVPALRDGSFALTESNAILQYLSEQHGDCRLFSRQAQERARISSWLFWESAHWQPALTQVLAAHVGHQLLPDVLPKPVAAPDWDLPGFRTLVDLLESALAQRAFLTGELSLADFAVAGMTTYFRSAGFPFASAPQLARWYERIEALDAWQETAAPLWSGTKR